MCELPKTQIMETALIHDPPKRDKVQTRNQTTKNKDNLHEKLSEQDLNDSLDKRRD